MFVGPRHIPAGLVDYGEDRIHSHKLPRPNRRAAALRITWKTHRVDRLDGTASQWRPGLSAVQLVLVDIDRFFVFGRGARRRRARSAEARGPDGAVASRLRRRVDR